MIVVMEQQAGAGPTARVVESIEAAGFGAHVFHGAERDVIAVLGDGEPSVLRTALETVGGVERVEATTRSFKLASRQVSPAGTTFPVGGTRIGGGLSLIVGTARPRPADVLLTLAREARDAGADVFWVGRGDSGDLRHDLIRALGAIRSEVGIPTVVDVWETSELSLLSRNADALQVPAAQMQNVPLIRATGQGDRPVFICRGQSSTIEEWLLAGERVMEAGNRSVALVEQGVRTFETTIKAMLDLNAVAVARRLSHLPVLVNPSLAAGQADIVEDLASAAAATGCEGVILDAVASSSDGVAGHRQALPMAMVKTLLPRLRTISAAVGR
jgi:3-deoxy-7-phosphoheptulonate synthase